MWNIDSFGLSLDEFEKKLSSFLEKQIFEQILTDLIKRGLELSDEDKIEWINSFCIDIEEAEQLITAFEKALKIK